MDTFLTRQVVSKVREERDRAVSRNLNMSGIERSVKEGVAAVREQTASLESLQSGLAKDDKALQGKLEKRRGELERSEKRLSTLQAVRPAYMDELEKLQAQLQQLYVVYLERFRNLEYLEGRVERHEAAAQAKADSSERQLLRMQRRLQAEEMAILRGDEKIDEEQFDRSMLDEDDDDEEEDDYDISVPGSRAQSAARGGVFSAGGGGGGRVVGTLDTTAMDDSDESSVEIESESGDEDVELGSGDDSDPLIDEDSGEMDSQFSDSGDDF